MDTRDRTPAAAHSGWPPLHAVPSARVSREIADIVAGSIAEDDVGSGGARIVTLVIDAGLADWGGATRVVPGTGEFRTTGQNSDLVCVIDAVQYRHHEGPCVDASVDGTVIASDQLATDTRWPTWAPEAVHAGVTAVLSVPLRSRRTRFGALNLYRGRNTVLLGHDDLRMAQLAAAHITALMAHEHAEHHLKAAVETRTVIGQAQGMLMERFRLTADQAFSTLRRHSQDTNTKLHTVAEQLVASRRLPDTIASQRRRMADPAMPSDRSGEA